MLTAMGKPFDAARAESVVRRLQAGGIPVEGLFLLGFPGETRESLADTVAFVERNRKFMANCWASFYQPVPGTVGWQMAVDRGWHGVGARNVNLTYVDPNLTANDIRSAKESIKEMMP